MKSKRWCVKDTDGDMFIFTADKIAFTDGVCIAYNAGEVEHIFMRFAHLGLETGANKCDT